MPAEIAPLYIDLEAPMPSSGVPKPGPLGVHLRDNHLQYAITWFAIALALAGVYLAYHWENGRLTVNGRTKAAK